MLPVFNTTKKYRINGKAISTQPHLCTSPHLVNGLLVIGQTFSLLFSNPTAGVQNRLAAGRKAVLNFPLADGTIARSRVLVASSTYTNSHLLVIFSLLETKGVTPQ